MQRPARRQLQSKESNAPDIKAPRSDIHSASCAGLTLARAKDVRGSQPGILEKIPPVEQAARATLVAHKFVMRPVRSGGVQKHPDSHLHALKVELSVSGIKNRVYRDARRAYRCNATAGGALLSTTLVLAIFSCFTSAHSIAAFFTDSRTQPCETACPRLRC